MIWHVITSLVAAALGGAVVYSLYRAPMRQLQQQLDDARTDLEHLKSNHVPSEFGTANSAEHIKFLYDKRLTLFNTRRGHEWKIYFGAMTLMGAVDAALVAGQLTLTGWNRGVWIATCLLVFAVVFGYESRLQTRNDHDRHAMCELYNRLCEFVGGIPKDSPVLETYTSPKSHCWWSRYGWAFPWQMILFIAVVAVSAALPFLKGP